MVLLFKKVKASLIENKAVYTPCFSPVADGWKIPHMRLPAYYACYRFCWFFFNETLQHLLTWGLQILRIPARSCPLVGRFLFLHQLSTLSQHRPAAALKCATEKEVKMVSNDIMNTINTFGYDRRWKKCD